MKKINEFENLMNNEQAAYKSDFSYLLFKSYRDTQRAGNELLNISDIIWESDYDSLVENLRKFGITEFTISCTFSGLLASIQALTERGCTMEGMTKVKDLYPTYMDGEHDLIPALKMRLD